MVPAYRCCYLSRSQKRYGFSYNDQLRFVFCYMLKPRKTGILVSAEWSCVLYEFWLGLITVSYTRSEDLYGCGCSVH